MPEERRWRIRALFDRAAELPAAERGAFLDNACQGDAALRAELEELLAHDAGFHAGTEVDGFLQSPLFRSPEKTPPGSASPASGEQPGLPPRIGRYRVLRGLGEGGMGTVYEAEQDSPRRTVALKVIRPGIVLPELVKRFSQEVQFLARLQHRGIAQVFEAGMGEDGRPFFAMEYIRGMPLDAYARGHGLDVASRLELLAKVCDAVQHAHDKGVIHRDLKPSNILVDETGEPKVLDFGVARATDADLLTSTDHTRTGQLVGTLGYMSPEQVTAAPAELDGRSDVYALGVVLFELLVDRLPYHLEHLPLPEVARMILEQEPSRLGSINPHFRGDVETIVAKALEKDKARRYQSAAELAADIRRHLRNVPIRARPPSALYQLGKFARRHKALVGGVAGVMAALVVGLVGTLLFAAREARQRGLAEHNAHVADGEKHAALRQAYRADLAAAAAALQSHDVAFAARQLDEAPEALRGWEWRHLHSRLDDSIAVFPAPVGATYLTLGADEPRLAVLADQRVRLLDELGRTERTVPYPLEHRGLWTVARTPQGLLYLGATERMVYLRDESGEVRLGVEAAAGDTAACLSLSPNLKGLAVTWKTPTGYSTAVYDSSGKEQVRLPDLHSAPVWSLTFSPDGTRLASTSEDGTARLWDVATGQPIGGPLRHPGKSKVLHAAFRRDGTRVLTTSADGTVCQWDAATGMAVEPPFERHTGEVWTATYSPDGRWVASAGTDRTVRLWQATGRQEALVLNGHTDNITQLVFSEDGRRLCSVSQDGTARTWEADPNANLPVLSGHSLYVYPVAYSPDGQWIASGSWDGTVRLWDALTGEPCAVMPLGNNVRALAFGPDSTWLVTGCDGDDRLQLWDILTARRRKSIKGPGKVPQALAVSPDGTRVAAMDSEGTFSLTELRNGREVASLDLLTRSDTRGALAWSPDGQRLALISEEKNIGLWDTREGQITARLSGHTERIFSVAFSPDGHQLVSAGRDRTVRVWDVDTGLCRAVLQGHANEVFAAVFHPGGTRIASAGRDGMIWLWDAATGEKLTRLQGHANYVYSLAFSPDGKSLASGSGDGTVRLWDTEPLARRQQARREAEAVRPEAERLVERLFAELGEPTWVAARLRGDEKLSDPLRRAALRAVMCRGGQARP
jgi:WD40 repeat protein/serine/threonine protein kinase